MKLDIAKMVHLGVEYKPAQHWPTFDGAALDRTKYVTASEIGYCARKIKLDKIAMLAGGYTAEAGTIMSSADEWGFFERGHNVEAWAVETIKRATNEDLRYTGKDQVSFTCGVQSGTPDGVFFHENASAFTVLEIKSVDPRTNFNKLPKFAHVDQVMQNADIIAESLDLVPLGGEILYVDASNYKNMRQISIEYDLEHAAKLEKRAELIMSTERPEDLKPEGIYLDHCKFCAHTAVCSKMIRASQQGESYDEDLTKARATIFRQR